MKYKVYQISTYNGHGKPPKPIEKTDVSDTHYVLPNGDIVHEEFCFLMDRRYFEIEIIEN